MGAFGELMPGRKLQQAGDEDSTGEGGRIPEGPLDLDSGMVQLTPPPEGRREEPRED